MGSHNHHRCYVEICASILSAISEKPMRKTWIMNGTNLNHVVATRHLERLVERGFLTVNGDDPLYYLTEDGKDFLAKFSSFKLIEDRLLGINESTAPVSDLEE